MRQGKNKKNGGDLALNRATSRRSREESFQRRDVRGNVATFQRIVIINVATLDINAATFQRGAKSTSRRYRDWLNKRHDVDIQRRDVTEKGNINVATLTSRC